MSEDDFPAPRTGFVLTHFLVVSDRTGPAISTG